MIQTKFCEKCKQNLPIQNFEGLKNCRKCHKKVYYQKNRTKFLQRSKNTRDNERIEKMKAGNYKWKGGDLKREEEMMKIFLESNNINLSDLFNEK